MKFDTYKRKTKLLHKRLSTIYDRSKVLSEVTQPTERQKQKVLTLYEETKEKAIEYNNIKESLLNTSDSVKPEEETVLEDLDGQVSETISDILAMLRSVVPPSSHDDLNISNTSNDSQSANTCHVRLPKIQLKTFNGDISQWIAFHNVFDVTINQNKSISDIDKFQYLLSCVQDEPFNLIKSLPLSNENYKIAYDTLMGRYHNPRVLKSLHINHIIDMPSCLETSAKMLRSFISQFREHSAALTSLDINVHDDNPVLMTLLLRKFDVNIRTKFESKRRQSNDLPTPDEFIKFLEGECCNMENAFLINNNSTRSSSHTVATSATKVPTVRTKYKNVALTAHNASNCCIYCNHDHVVYSCSQFSKLTPNERLSFIKANNYCVNCLGSHKFKECTSKNTCRRCNKKHHTFLHLNNTPQSPNIPNKFSPSSRVKSAGPGGNGDQGDPPDHPPTADIVHQQSVHTVNVNNDHFTTVLGTALLKLETDDNRSTVVRALVDSASSCSFINSDIVNQLQLKRQFCKTSSQVNGISSTSVKTKGLTHVNISACNNEEISLRHPVLILDRITSDMPTAIISPQVKSSLANFKLADPKFDQRGPIQMLIGADLFMKIIKGSKYCLGENMPYALDTVLGYVIIGKAPVTDNNHANPMSNCTTLFCLQEDPLHQLMSSFWDSEQPPDSLKITDDEIACEKHFADTHSRCPDTGKYTVKLPFKHGPEKLGDSAATAKRRFFSLENKLNSNPEFKQLYSDFMQDYKNTGHMTLLTKGVDKENHYFLPHHGVLKESSSTTKLRVVFDASSKTTSQYSLNDLLYVGPKLHNDIVTIISNFRRHKYVFTTDIKQMFRSINVHKADHKYQLIYWRDNCHEPLSIFKLNTVTYGLGPSPYIANKVIQQLCEDEQHLFPQACEALKNHIYVDDLALGADNLDEAVKLQKEVITVLQKGTFELRKWTANHKRLLADIPENFHDKPIKFRSPDQPLVNILGLLWIPKADSFTYQINIAQSRSQTPTKRNVLSDIAKIFDPCGFLAPVVILAKLFIQTLWLKGFEWDSALPCELAEKWLSFYNELPELEKIMFPRYFGTSNSQNLQLHGFCDASERSYASCVYLRAVDSQGNVTISLVLAKTRVAPLKHVTLPRLELCGAHLLAQLLHYCSGVLSTHCHIDSVHAWCDSTITLHWIHTPPYKLKTYVANRVSQIQDLVSPSCWSHVPSAQNPADCASRGLKPSQLLSHAIWWNGPEWLFLDSNQWPKNRTTYTNITDVSELKPSKDFTLVSSLEPVESEILNKYSSWDKLQRIVALLLRFKNNARKNSSKFTGVISSTEIHSATKTICLLVQALAFSSDIKALKQNKPCSKQLRSLSPYVDADGLIRVGGRLNNSCISTQAKHPTLLPKSHFISSLIVDFYHIQFLHAGPQFLQAHVSKKFWILSSRDLIRSRVHNCLTCYRFKPQTVYPKMGDLPAERVNPAPCFKICGVDYGGPFDVKVHTLRRAQVVKAYLCLFVCFTTKAIHIEMSSDLTTDSFIAALTRFIGRRGAPSDIYLDNATNFVGGNNQIVKLMRNLLKTEPTRDKINELGLQHTIKFHFIPPSAPHFGGIWESGIKSAKTHLKRVIGERILTLEEFQTLTIRVEAILNSRPLCPMSADPAELDYLTPGHFIIGRPLTSLIEMSYQDETPLNRLKRWQAVQAMAQRLWKRWQTEYLHTLQQRKKWTKNNSSLQVGDLVLIHDSCSPPQSWPVGRIISTHPGDDGITRVVTLKTSRGELKRPIVKVSPFPNN